MSAQAQPATAKQCRAEALRMSELARDAHDPTVRATFLEQARDWGRRALSVEAREIGLPVRRPRVW